VFAFLISHAYYKSCPSSTSSVLLILYALKSKFQCCGLDSRRIRSECVWPQDFAPTHGIDTWAGVDLLVWSQPTVHQSSSWSILTSLSKQAYDGNNMKAVIWAYWPYKKLSEGLLRRGRRVQAISLMDKYLLLWGSVCQNTSRESTSGRENFTLYRQGYECDISNKSSGLWSSGLWRRVIL
jgi:hypothetical protein